MEKRSFEMLLELLRFLEKEELKDDTLDAAISKLVKKYKKDLTQEQRTTIKKTFLIDVIHNYGRPYSFD
ncbi:hypothetical protein ACFLQN_02065 [Candidatus Aenigmatarchaeota archaeon]